MLEKLAETLDKTLPLARFFGFPDYILEGKTAVINRFSLFGGEFLIEFYLRFRGYDDIRYV